jgi:acetylornithine/N-succinyldiaminopimelate aminotransferase
MDYNTNKYYYEKDKSYYLQTFRRYPIALERGEGATVWDVEGRPYLDALAGIAVNNLGHCHPKVVKAVQEQAAKLMHISNFYASKPQVELSEKLCDLSGMQRVFFTNSGAESVEGAIKLARKYAHSKGKSGTIISMKNSFHGRTLATIATGKKAYQRGFGPMPDGFINVPFNDFEALKEVANEQTAAIILEPIQGEGGIHVAKPCFLRALRTFCNQNDIILIFDEIQCGIGRTGKLFAKDHYQVQPDIITLAKGLGSGFPIGAILTNEKVNDAMDFGDHGTTFGGNPLACAAALATLKVMTIPGFLDDVLQKGGWLKHAIESLDLPGMVEIRGLGLMIGVVFEDEAKPIVAAMLEAGVLANATSGNVLRLVPPLTITKPQLQELVAAIEKTTTVPA